MSGVNRYAIDPLPYEPLMRVIPEKVVVDRAAYMGLRTGKWALSPNSVPTPYIEMAAPVPYDHVTPANRRKERPTVIRQRENHVFAVAHRRTMMAVVPAWVGAGGAVYKMVGRPVIRINHRNWYGVATWSLVQHLIRKHGWFLRNFKILPQDD